MIHGKKMGKNKRIKKAKCRRVSLEGDKSFTDFLCPICLEILIEPVQLPCQHELCMVCFKTHVEDTSLTCPMCRLRISVWARKNGKTNTLVNKERWELIQATFPERVKRRLEGLDDLTEDDYAPAPNHIIAPDGEVGKEFQQQMKKIQDEEDAVSQASLDFIQTLQEEERVERERQEELDLVAAQELQKQEMANLGVTLKSPSQHQKELLALLKPKSPMKLRNQRALPTQNQNTRSKSTSQVQRNILTSPNHTITTFFKKSNTASNHGDVTLLERTRVGESSSSTSSSCTIVKKPMTGELPSCKIVEKTRVRKSAPPCINIEESPPPRVIVERTRVGESSSTSSVNNEKNNNLVDQDYELALSLQNEYNKNWHHGSTDGKKPLRTLNQIDVNNSPNVKISPLKKAKRKIFNQDGALSKVKRKT